MARLIEPISAGLLHKNSLSRSFQPGGIDSSRDLAGLERICAYSYCCSAAQSLLMCYRRVKLDQSMSEEDRVLFCCPDVRLQLRLNNCPTNFLVSCHLVTQCTLSSGTTRRTRVRYLQPHDCNQRSSSAQESRFYPYAAAILAPRRGSAVQSAARLRT